MNLPCDNCKAIRPFTGEPLKCDVCGWGVRDTASLPKPELAAVEPAPLWTPERKVGPGLLLRISLWGVVIVMTVFIVAQFFMPERHPDILTPGRYRLALKYGLTVDQVSIDPKPPGCDFTDAPLGDKHCHYEQNVYLERECLDPNCPIKRVSVSWYKVRD
jgi:hypothetical protein